MFFTITVKFFPAFVGRELLFMTSLTASPASSAREKMGLGFKMNLAGLVCDIAAFCVMFSEFCRF